VLMIAMGGFVIGELNGCRIWDVERCKDFDDDDSLEVDR